MHVHPSDHHSAVPTAVLEPFREDVVGETSGPEAAVRLLQARGFLLEEQDGQVFLSDNSAAADAEFLDLLLRETELGMVEDRRVVLQNGGNPVAWQLIYRVYYAGEAAGEHYWGSWNYFRNRRHGFKVPVQLLDPFIARLVKAVSAVGLVTDGSCDGHGLRPPMVALGGLCPALWFRVLLSEFIAQNVPLCARWLVSDTGECTIRRREPDLPSLYLEIQRVAELLYVHRVELREVKTIVTQALDPLRPQRMEAEELEQRLRDEFRRHSSRLLATVSCRSAPDPADRHGSSRP